MIKWLAVISCLVCLPIPAYGADSLSSSALSSSAPSGTAPSGSASSSSGASSTTPSTATPSSETRGYADKWALIVGVNSFPDQKGQLKYGESDAQRFRDFLVNDANFETSHVLLLQGKDATAKNIRQTIDSLKKVCQKDDLVLVYLRTPGIYASHIGSAYFAAADTSMADLQSTAFEMVEFPVSLGKSLKVADVALILDSDFSGKALQANRQNDYNTLRAKERQKRLYVYAATGESERSAESDATKGSVFTGLLIEKLKDDSIARLSKSASATRLGSSNCSPGEVILSTPAYLPRKFSLPVAKGTAGGAVSKATEGDAVPKGAAGDAVPKGGAGDTTAPKAAN